MRALTIVALVAVGCASTPDADVVDRTVYEGYAVDPVREAVRTVVDEVAHPKSVVRVSGERVITEGWIGRCGEHVACGSSAGHAEVATPWTTLEVRWTDMGTDTAVEVQVVYESKSHCRDDWNEGSRDVGCLPDRLGSTGVLEREILDRIRTRLEGDGESLL